MRVLYSAYRHDPMNPEGGSGADHAFYNALTRSGGRVKICGPLADSPAFAERGLKRCYTAVTRKRYAKFPITLAWKASQMLNRSAAEFDPDLIFTMFPPGLVFYDAKRPCLYRLDTTFAAWARQYPEFGKSALALLKWQEKRAFEKCARLITHSDWCRDSLIEDYGVPPTRIVVFPNPSALPRRAIPRDFGLREHPDPGRRLNLLFIGRDPHRKGLDIALGIVEELARYGVDVRLTVCGLNGEDRPHVRYEGFLRKSVETELARYVEHLSRAHLLLHPARFDPSPIATSDAAAFGVPAITNGVGGISTSVRHEDSGIVLPIGSRADSYVKAIRNLVSQPGAYARLRETTRARFERALNWEIAGKRLAALAEEVVSETAQTGSTSVSLRRSRSRVH